MCNPYAEPNSRHKIVARAQIEPIPVRGRNGEKEARESKGTAAGCYVPQYVRWVGSSIVGM